MKRMKRMNRTYRTYRTYRGARPRLRLWLRSRIRLQPRLRPCLLRLLLCLTAIVLPTFALMGCASGGSSEQGQTDQAGSKVQIEAQAEAQTGAQSETQSDTQTKHAQAGSFEIQITGDVDNEAAAELLAAVNRYRKEQDMDPLTWNETAAEALRVRAAELAIDLSQDRLDGTPGEEVFRAGSEEIGEVTDQLLHDKRVRAMLRDPGQRSFSAGVYRSYSGPYYVAAGLYEKSGAKDLPDTSQKERTFTLTATDEALHCRGQLMDQEMEPVDPKELYRGEGYYYCIFNHDPANPDEYDQEDLVTVYAESSDPEVVSIDKYGDVTAKRAGTATLTVRPARGSGIEFKQKVEVN